jgi:hypothetical protein
VARSAVYLVASPVRSFDRERAIAAMRKRKQDAITNAATSEAGMQQIELEDGADAGKKDRAAGGVGLALGKGVAGAGMIMNLVDNIQARRARGAGTLRRPTSARWPVRPAAAPAPRPPALALTPCACALPPPCVRRSTSPTCTCGTRTTRPLRLSTTRPSGAPCKS